jgi:hypothetical protein
MKKISYQKIILVVVFILLAGGSVLSQTSSPYTRLGIGDAQFTYSPKRAAMGNLGVSIADPNFIGTVNPASWYRLTNTRIEIAGKNNFVFLSDESSSASYSDLVLTGFTFGFPISTLYGISSAFGLVPFTDVSYKVTETGTDRNFEYEGSGGLSKLFVGSSYKLPLDLNLGASFDYYFGNLAYTSRVNFIHTPALNAHYQKSVSPRGIGTTVGIITPDLAQYFLSNNFTDFRLGGSIIFISELNTDTVVTANFQTLTDTLSSNLIKMNIPFRLNTGLSFILNARYLFTFDYSYQPFSQFKIDGIQQNLRDAHFISAGFESRAAREGGSFLEQIILRAGLSYHQTEYVIDNTGINQYSAAAGLALPIMPGNTIDIGVEYSTRGTRDGNLFKEDVIKLSFGVSLSEIWFIRQEK